MVGNGGGGIEFGFVFDFGEVGLMMCGEEKRGREIEEVIGWV